MNKKIGNRKETVLNNMKDQAIELFEQVEKMLDMSMVMFDENDNNIALDIIEEDRYLDQLQQDLIISVNMFILKEQPKAGDLRMALGVYGMSYDLERIGDYCKGFAKSMIKMKQEENLNSNIVSSLVKELKLRLSETKVAFDTSNHQMAKSIAKRGNEIDELSKALTKDAINGVLEDTKKDEAKDFARIVVVAKLFERGGDHLINICEQISFIEKGQIYHYS